MASFKLQFLLVFVGVGMTIVANVATAWVMQPMMDNLFIAKEKEQLLFIPLMMLGIYVVKGVGRYIQSVYTSYIGLHIVTQFRSLLLRKILFLDMATINKTKNGEFISRITNDIARIQYFVSLMLAEMVREFFTVVALLAYVVYLNPLLAFYALVVLPVVILPISYLSRKLRKISYGSQEKNSDLLAKTNEMLVNVELIHTHHSQKFEIEQFAKINWDFFKINLKAIYFNQLASPILEVVAATSLAFVIFFGAKEVYAHHMSVGEFMSFLTAIGLVFQPARGLGIIYTKMQDALAASARMFSVLDLESTIKDGNETLQNIQTIEYKDVDLYYEEKQALFQINFSVQRPKKVAFVGESGGGKSSVVNLLIRLYDPTSGEILINGKNIKNYTLASLRQEIAFVSQKVFIFADTIANNIAYGKEYDQEKVIDALKKAGAYEFVQKFPQGINTYLEEFGSNLSGGQRQRIALARAIYKDADVFILDEATAALDNESEAKFIQELNILAKEKIIIAIAHRLQTVVDYDVIYVLKDGKILDAGTHQELYQRCTYYKALYQKSLKENN